MDSQFYGGGYITQEAPSQFSMIKAPPYGFPSAGGYGMQYQSHAEPANSDDDYGVNLLASIANQDSMSNCHYSTKRSVSSGSNTSMHTYTNHLPHQLKIGVSVASGSGYTQQSPQVTHQSLTGPQPQQCYQNQISQRVQKSHYHAYADCQQGHPSGYAQHPIPAAPARVPSGIGMQCGHGSLQTSAPRPLTQPPPYHVHQGGYWPPPSNLVPPQFPQYYPGAFQSLNGLYVRNDAPRDYGATSCAVGRPNFFNDSAINNASKDAPRSPPAQTSDEQCARDLTFAELQKHFTKPLEQVGNNVLFYFSSRIRSILVSHRLQGKLGFVPPYLRSPVDDWESSDGHTGRLRVCKSLWSHCEQHSRIVRVKGF
eukprot:gb/GECG01005549.1/.p1 GENE.gb/GECG01005549.1/~~gb/GECG01005549.1/.p1  ORF type:complete len:368 (+),score=18.51 gb/GECG01005549.1/:1-1104(+)